MVICYFGIYHREYSRNRIFISGLKQNGAEIIECASRRQGLVKYFDLIIKHWRIRKKYDVMIVGFPGYQSMLLAKILTRQPIIFDALSSFYDSMIIDRSAAKHRSLKAFYYWALDWLSCQLADVVILDTEAQIEYFVKAFHIRRDKFRRIFIGSDDESIYPLEKKVFAENFLVHFHGAFNPLQGVEFIVRAAKLLENENIKFNIIGKGQTYKKVRELAVSLKAENINFIDPVGYDQLKKYMGLADVCLGVFGETEKARQVIPNKAYESLAAGRSLITGNTPAIKELLTDRENVLLCNMSDSDDLAEKIKELKNNTELNNAISRSGYELFQKKLRPKILGGQLLNLIQEIIDKR